LAESVIGLYKTELIRKRSPWKGLEAVELGIWWFNHHRLLEPIGNIPPVEFEQAHYRRENDPNVLTTLNSGALR
jgi:transposase InsO family protein